MAERQARGPVDYDHNKYAALLHAKPIDPISTYDVLTVLQSRSNATPETAKRLQSWIEAILDAAKAQGLRTGDNPARWRGHLDQLLTKRGKKGVPLRIAMAAVPRDESANTGCIITHPGRGLEYLQNHVSLHRYLVVTL